MVLNYSKPDNCVLKNDDVVEIVKFIDGKNRQGEFIGKRWQKRGDLFTFPCASSE